MHKVTQSKRPWRPRMAVLLSTALLGVMLSGCGNQGGQATEPASTGKVESTTQAATEAESVTEAQSATKPESATETEPMTESASATTAESTPAQTTAEDAGANAKSGDGQDLLSLEYTSDGDTPTITTVVFHLNEGTVEVNALASSMYELAYESTYSVADNKLVIDTVTGITATDTSGVAKVIGLPETMEGSVFHTVSDNAGAVTLTIQFGDPEKPDEAALLGEITLEADMLTQLGMLAAN